MLGNVFILGDSYSTFYKYIPEGYEHYYDEEGPNYLKSNSEMGLSTNDVCKLSIKCNNKGVFLICCMKKYN